VLLKIHGRDIECSGRLIEAEFRPRISDDPASRLRSNNPIRRFRRDETGLLGLCICVVGSRRAFGTWPQRSPNRKQHGAAHQNRRKGERRTHAVGLSRAFGASLGNPVQKGR